MKANELMIGDWVKTPLGIGKVTAIDAACLPGFQTARVFHKKRQEYQDAFVDIDKVRPIPLTPEILAKNGFQKHGDEEPYIYTLRATEIEIACYSWPNGYYRVIISHANAILRKTIRYVHELQHALRLLRINKEIEL